jgi:hypothetical protein
MKRAAKIDLTCFLRPRMRIGDDKVYPSLYNQYFPEVDQISNAKLVSSSDALY